MSTSININVSKTPYQNTNSNFDSQNNDALPKSDVTLTAVNTSSHIKVYTFRVDGNNYYETAVFTNGNSPYKAKPGGNPHTLKKGITGTIILSTSKNPVSGADTNGTNGTINVGGGNNGDGDDDDDDGGHGHGDG